ncbi:MAG: amino acid ABC transporter permease [Planctomycetota bacterium]|nr:amino acid ABC transporter permease [Planctomycetota bacterium]
MGSTTSRTRSSRDFWIRAGVTAGVLGVAGLFLFVLTPYEYRWERMVEGTRVSQWAAAFGTTLWMSLAALVISLVFGLAGGLARMSRKPGWNQLGGLYVEFVRGTPLLVQVIFAYFVGAVIFANLLAQAGAPDGLIALVENPHVVGVVALGIFAGAYVAEIVRAAVESVDRGQTEAAMSQGLTRAQVQRLVVFPQALRRMLPPLAGQFASLVKDSSLLMLIPGVVEISMRTSLIRSRTYLDNEPLLIALGLYFILCFGLSRLARRLELRLAA